MSYDLGPKPEKILNPNDSPSEMDYVYTIAQAQRAINGEPPFDTSTEEGRRELAQAMIEILHPTPSEPQATAESHSPSEVSQDYNAYELPDLSSIREIFIRFSDYIRMIKMSQNGAEELDRIAEEARIRPALDPNSPRRAEESRVLSRRGFLAGVIGVAGTAAHAKFTGSSLMIGLDAFSGNGGATNSERNFDDRPIGDWVPEEVRNWQSTVAEIISRDEITKGNPNTLPDSSAMLAIMLMISGGDPEKVTADGRIGLFGLSQDLAGIYAPFISELEGTELSEIDLHDPYTNTLIAAAHIDNLRRLAEAEHGQPYIAAPEPLKWGFILQSYDDGNRDRSNALVDIVPGMVDEWEDEISLTYQRWADSINALVPSEDGEN